MRLNTFRSSLAVAPVLLLAVYATLPRTVPSRADAGVSHLAAERTSTLGTACTHVRAGPLEYHWPIKPFRRQHPIRGYFGDPRTLGREPLGTDRGGSPGSFTLHSGVDISAAPGTPVYPVVSGIAHVHSGDFISVTTDDGRVFQYFHIRPAVGPGQPVIADRTVLGRVKSTAKHVHLGEIDHFRIHNPLDPGHLEPYRDRTVPEIESLAVTTSDGAALALSALHGSIRIVADARDLPAMPVPGHWFDFPVTPALVTWRLTLGDRLILRRTVADWRHTRPAERDFWHIYAAGTYQNFPDFDHHFYWRRAGRYLFNLTPEPLDTRLLVNGVYTITVSASDTCGNRGTLSQKLTVDNPPATTTIDHWRGAARTAAS